MQKRARSTLILTALAVASLLLWLATPAPLVVIAVTPALPADVDRHIAKNEQLSMASYGLIPGTEKRVRWQRAEEKTHYAIVYLPGFSATRQEIAPTAELVADALGANLFETRLAGHGRATRPMQGVRAEDWLDDAAEALAIGARLGERIIVIGTSTGATLALAMVGHPAMDNVEFIVMISPNFAPQDSSAKWLTRPAGPLLARLFAGETRSWDPHNEEHGLYWSTSYPMRSVVEVMRLVDLAQSKLPLSLNQSILTFLSPDDTVVSPIATRLALAGIKARRMQLIEVHNSGDPNKHVLAGRVLSPQTTETIAAQIVEFIQ